VFNFALNCESSVRGRALAIGRYDQHFDELLPVETNLSVGACTHLALNSLSPRSSSPRVDS
jgi:hypothetical protein